MDIRESAVASVRHVPAVDNRVVHSLSRWRAKKSLVSAASQAIASASYAGRKGVGEGGGG